MSFALLRADLPSAAAAMSAAMTVLREKHRALGRPDPTDDEYYQSLTCVHGFTAVEVMRNFARAKEMME